MKSNVVISQKDNYAMNFGLALRSSGIFYFKMSETFTTTISFMNYWQLRANTQVSIVASVRDMQGTLVKREPLNFDEGMVVNYRPNLTDSEFEGSVEIEVFALQDLRIPYAAIIAIYESSKSVSMVHGYSRIYSLHEVEEGRTITQVEESCWTLRDSNSIRSFAVIHNGWKAMPSQPGVLTVTLSSGRKIKQEFTMPSMNSYASIKLYPSDIIDDLSTKMDSGIANGNLKLDLGNSFSRLLVGNENIETGEFQITHSNFNYSVHKTDRIVKEDAFAIMPIPLIDCDELNAIVYPDSDIGEYKANMVMHGDSAEHSFSTGEIKVFNIPKELETIEFRRNDGDLPSRIVSGIFGRRSTDQLAFECSIGVVHAERPPKRMWWGVCNHTSSIYVVEMSEIYGENSDHVVNLRIYSKSSHEFLSVDINPNQLKKLISGKKISDLLSESGNLSDWLENDFGFYTFFSNYPGYFVYTSIHNGNGSMTVEHGF